MDNIETLIEPQPETTDAARVEPAQSLEPAPPGTTPEFMRTDPAAALETLAKQFSAIAAKEAEEAVRRALEERTRLKALMDDFFDDPVNASLKPFRAEMEHLMRERGMAPGDAIDLINALRRKFEAAAREKAEVSRRIRRLASLEEPEGASSTGRGESEFDRTLKKAKTLEEMFAGLKKLGRV